MEEKHNDGQTRTLQWRCSTLKIFLKALERYIRVMAPYVSKGNTQITQEVQQMKHLSSYIGDILSKCGGDYDFVQCSMQGKTYGKLYDVLYKYYRFKDGELNNKRNEIIIEAALEGDQAAVGEINEVLSNPVWEEFNRQQALVPDFFDSRNTLKSSNPNVQQQISIGTMYGQFVGVNYGDTKYSTTNDVLSILSELTNLLINSNIPDEVKSESLGDIQTIQAQMMKKNPDKEIVEKSNLSLQNLSNLAQLGSFILQVAPLLEKLRDFIAKVQCN